MPILTGVALAVLSLGLTGVLWRTFKPIDYQTAFYSCHSPTDAPPFAKPSPAFGSAGATAHIVVGDVVIVGGGTGGLTIAHQLAMHTSLNVHVLEAGDDPTSYDSDIDVPIKQFNVSINPNYDWGFRTTPQLHAANATVPLARFRGLGGCSQHSGASFWLGSRYTYDKWPADFQYDDFKRAALQLEGCVSFGPPNHGTTGPLHTQLDDLDQIDPYLIAWKDAALQAGHQFTPDGNVPLGKGYMPHLASIKNGRRSGPYDVFKSVSGKHPNLTVHLNTTVTKLLFAGPDADGNLIVTGVKADQIDSHNVRTKVTFRATKAVVMAAGAYQTPHILMVSGIGDRAALQDAGIRVRVHRPGVGKNLKEHSAILHVIRTKQTSPINDPAFFADQAAQYAAHRTGYFAHPVADHAVVTVSSGGDKNNPAVPADVVLVTFPYTFFPGFEPNQIISLVTLAQPNSSGTVTVSSPSVYDPPIIDPQFFSNPTDFDRMQQGLDILRDIFHQPVLSTWFDTELFPADANNLTIKSKMLSTDHPMGTCMMGFPDEELAVVDSHAAVFGTRGLYVADSSVIRTVDGATPNASTHATVILIAQLVANKLMCKLADVCW